MKEPEYLKLVAFDQEDLEIISAHCQDAVFRMEDIAFLQKERRLALLMNRFDWENALDDNKNQFRRRRSALRFECVMAVKHRNMDLTKKDQVKDILAIKFEEKKAPMGTISLILAGGSEIKIEVECIEAILQDLGAVWETKFKPNHSLTKE